MAVLAPLNPVMGLQLEFPIIPHENLRPDTRWFPAHESRRQTDLSPKMVRMGQGCDDASAAHANGDSRLFPPAPRPTKYDLINVDQSGLEEHLHKDLARLVAGFREYRG
jgi:hypothetical protein